MVLNVFPTWFAKYIFESVKTGRVVSIPFKSLQNPENRFLSILISLVQFCCNGVNCGGVCLSVNFRP